MTAIGFSGRQRLNRELQRKLLEQLSAYYPHSHVGSWEELGSDASSVKVNLFYLKEHGLIDTNAIVERNFGGGFHYSYAKITKNGMDFLEQDGGLSAILGVITIRLHDDTIKALVESKIIASDLPPRDKQRYLDRLKSLPADATKHLAMKLIDLGLEKGQPAIDLLGKLFESTPGA